MSWMQGQWQGAGAMLGLTVALSGMGCSDSGDMSGGNGRTGPVTPGDFGNSPATDPATPSTPGDFGNTGAVAPGDRPVLNPGANVEEGEIKFSFIWIANTLEGTVSKLDTRSMEEVGRYYTSPGGTGLPSRTSVGPTGDVVVANRGGASNAPGGDGAGVMKVFGDPENCVDTNMDGVITTSTGAGDILAWGTDECVGWFQAFPYFSNRPVAWAPAPTPDAPPVVWTAGTMPGGCPNDASPCQFEVLVLNGETGVTEASIPVETPAGVCMLGIMDFGGIITGNYGPYGGAADSGGNFWTFTANTSFLVRVDAVTHAVLMWPIEPAGNGYGITIDNNGNIHLCGSQGISRFSPSTETWINGVGPVPGFNGCMTDGVSKIWVAGGADNGDPGLHSFNAETLQSEGSFPLGAVKGVSVDVDGYVWGVGSSGFLGLGANDQNTAWKLDAATGDFWTYEGLNGAYSYSDMTGHGLESAGIQPPLE